MALNAKQLKAIALLMEGKTQRETAKIIEVDEDTVYRWKRNNAEFQAKFDDEMRQTFKDLAAQARLNIMNLATAAESENVRLNANKDILSRAGYDASQRVEQVSETTIKVAVEEDE